MWEGVAKYLLFIYFVIGSRFRNRFSRHTSLWCTKSAKNNRLSINSMNLILIIIMNIHHIYISSATNKDVRKLCNQICHLELHHIVKALWLKVEHQLIYTRAFICEKIKVIKDAHFITQYIRITIIYNRITHYCLGRWFTNQWKQFL